MSSCHGEHGSRSAKRKLQRRHARSYTASYIPSEPQSDYFHRGHVGNLLFGRQKTTKTEELIYVRRKQKKPYSAVTVAIERLTSEENEEDAYGGIPDLVDVIKLQATGPREATRALRKKLKYGNVQRQLRALEILDGLVQNAGPKFEHVFASDDALLERLRVCGVSSTSDPAVKAKCRELFRGWAIKYKKVSGMEDVVNLLHALPDTRKVVTQDRSKVLRETEENPFQDDELEEPSTPVSSKPGPSKAGPSHSRQSSLTTASASTRERASSIMSGSAKKVKKDDKKDKKKKHKPFNLEAEKEAMKAAIAESTVASTNLLNALRHIDREKERISENKTASQYFDTCKLLRRKILRYIQHVEAEEWLGGLLHANDGLVNALMAFEQLDRSIDADSDSDDEMAEQAHLYKMAEINNAERKAGRRASDATTQQLHDLTLGTGPLTGPHSPTKPAHRPAPPTPVQTTYPRAQESEDEEEEEDENDPFADRNALD
ncbi:hypothetical protein BCON_0108g00250 [Botryotinia convoluta]|uniref:VHS domain-containing protein n=1 Tax=Botryotinia convoluta TaxID=54673 RepID=A0A4Z1HYR2_9HELO|nr:hypothetical protein BCON_0108g00250 [Botryotinia convoluta]